MENILKTAYMKSFAEEYVRHTMKKVVFDQKSPQACKRPDYMTLFRKREATPLQDKYTVVHCIPDRYWKFRTTMSGKPVVLGSGSFSNVYKGILAPGKEKVAIKVLTNHPMYKHLVTREALTQKFLEGTGYVPKLHGVIRMNARYPMLAMEYLKGYTTLYDLLTSKQYTSNLQRLKIALKVSDALNKFHLRNVLHNDLKPDNVMVNMTNPDDPQIKIIDFGHATHMESLTLDLSDKQLHAAQHVAPEVRGGQPSNSFSDVYSLGVILTMLSHDRQELQDLQYLAHVCTSMRPLNRPQTGAIVQYISHIIRQRDI